MRGEIVCESPRVFIRMGSSGLFVMYKPSLVDEDSLRLSRIGIDSRPSLTASRHQGSAEERI